MNSKTKEVRQYQSEAFYGIARCYSRRGIERAGTLWFDNATAGMDSQSVDKFKRLKILPHRVFTNKPLAVDIKSDVNIWKWNPRAGNPYPYEEFIKGLSEKEIECLERL